MLQITNHTQYKPTCTSTPQVVNSLTKLHTTKMGNCIVLQEKVVKVMKTDGKILEYKAPIKVYQVLSQFGGQYAISESLSVIQNLLPNSNMLAGQLYYLLPILPVPPPKIAKKKKVVKFAKEVVDQEEAKKQIRTTEAVRIKLVISKKELQALLSSTEGGLITVNDIVNRLQKIQDIKLGDPVLKQ